MTESKTPICDMVRRLMSRGLSPDAALDEAAAIEETLASTPTVGGLIEERRKMERERKARWRAGQRTGQPRLHISSLTESKTQIQKKKVSKTDPVVTKSPGTPDGWPHDYEAQFWTNFPKQRRGDRPQVFSLLAKMRKDKTVTWEALFAGVLRYAASDDVARNYAKAPLPWLRGHRWEIEHVKRGGPNGEGNRKGTERVNHVANAAARRFGGGGGDGAAPGPAGPVPPRAGMGDERPGAPRGEQPAFDLDLQPGPDGVFRGH